MIVRKKNPGKEITFQRKKKKKDAASCQVVRTEERSLLYVPIVERKVVRTPFVKAIIGGRR